MPYWNSSLQYFDNLFKVHLWCYLTHLSNLNL